MAWILETTGIGIWLNPLPFGRLNYDAQTRRLFFIPPGVESTSELFWNRIHPDDREFMRSAIQTALDNHTLFESDHRAVDPATGQVRWIHAAGKATYAEDGPPIWFDGISYDITPRKQAEDQIRHLNESLQNKVNELHTLLEIVPVGVWIGNHDCSVIAGNPAAYRMVGLPVGINASITAAEPEVPSLKMFLNGVAVPPEEAPMQVVARTGKPLNNFEHDIVFPDGTRKTVYGSAAPVFDFDGWVRGVIAAYTDFTERKQAEALLKDALQRVGDLNRDLERRAAELQAINQELDAFTYSVAHDLRAPIASIENLLRLVMTVCGDQLPEDASTYLRLAQQNAEAMNLLIDALLSLSRSSRQPLQKEAVDMHAMVEQVLEEMRPALANRHIDLVIATLPVAEADPVLIKQVWTNLISNAIKYTRHRDQARIEIGSQSCDSNETIYYVRDNGTGFDMANANRLFGLFQRLHSEEDYEGTGVGLAVVQRIIRRHGGRVWAASEVDKGATFYFTVSAP